MLESLLLFPPESVLRLPLLSRSPSDPTENSPPIRIESLIPSSVSGSRGVSPIATPVRRSLGSPAGPSTLRG